MAQILRTELTDLAEAEHVEVFVDAQHKLWVNVNGECLLRIGTVKHLTMDDPVRGQDCLW